MEIMYRQCHLLVLILTLVTLYRNVSSQAIFGSFGGEVLSGFTNGLDRRQPQGVNRLQVNIPNGIANDLSSSSLPVNNLGMGNQGGGFTGNFGNAMMGQGGMSGGFNMQNMAGGNSGAGGGSGYSGYGGDDDNSGGGGYGSNVPNAGYGGYPGRGGLSGYWEPGVKPVPLAMQGWGLFIPRPPVEITTPTTTVATTPKPATTAAPTTTTTKPVPSTTTTTTTPTTTTTNKPVTTTASYQAVGYPIAQSGSANKNLPQVFMLNGQRVILTPVDEALTENNSGNVANFKTSEMQMNVAVPRGPITCSPTLSPNVRGVCVSESEIQFHCSNMIISNSDACQSAQFCCFVESNN